MKAEKLDGALDETISKMLIGIAQMEDHIAQLESKMLIRIAQLEENVKKFLKEGNRLRAQHDKFDDLSKALAQALFFIRLPSSLFPLPSSLFPFFPLFPSRPSPLRD